MTKKRFTKTLKTYSTKLVSNKQSLFFRKLYLAYDLFFKRYGKAYFSGFGEDFVLNNLFHRKKNGFYVDIGCWHPKWLSNTYLLHKKGWEGINIDMDDFKIQMFNMARKNAVNICTAVSDEEKEFSYYYSKDHSAMNTLDSEFARAAMMAKKNLNYEIKKTKSLTLDKIISETKYAQTEIDLLSIDVEGHELPVLRSLDFEIYKPKVIVVELHVAQIEDILKSELYQFMIARNYSLYSWLELSLIFIREGYRTNNAIVRCSHAIT